MSFNFIIHENQTEYGIIYGNSTVVLLKTGLNGSINGYENKYLNLATQINEIFGFTVVIVSNPYDGSFKTYLGLANDYIKNTLELIKEELPIAPVKYYYIGVSNGALIGLFHSYKYPIIEKSLLINMPLYIMNIFAIQKCIAKYPKPPSIIYGSLDDSFSMVKYLKAHMTIITGEDHFFSKGKKDISKVIINFLKET